MTAFLSLCVSSQSSSARVGEGAGGRRKRRKNMTARKIKEGVRIIILTQACVQYISALIFSFDRGSKEEGNIFTFAVLWIWTAYM